MKTEDELLDLLAKAHGLNSIAYVNDFIAESVIYDTQGFDSPIRGKEKVFAELDRWFEYNRLFSVFVETVRYSASQDKMGYISLEKDYDEIKSCMVIESEAGLITRIYEVYPVNTGRRQFQSLKRGFFLPRLESIPQRKQMSEPPSHRET